MRVHPLVPGLAVGLVLALGGCGSDDEETTTSASTGTTAAQSASTTASGATSGTEITGTGYRTTVPQGWQDASARTAGTAIRIDKTYAEPGTSASEFAANVVIIRENPASLKGVKIEQLEKQLREQAATSLSAPVPDAEDPLKLDGDDAVRWTLRRTQGDQELVQRQIASIHDDALYTVTVSTAADDDADGEQHAQTIIDGWKWE
ncbi:hypothetical protein [Patulibacter sp.]|uniref:hypothetical protein n=1 Tax=Patulibacter sp. TaxID=1912859 RepID=UPI00272324DD|nr:hypothetical protein [Patulibacter sp.]MDO9409787.1 hypothetical protein [Patulibacter sp.]